MTNPKFCCEKLERLVEDFFVNGFTVNKKGEVFDIEWVEHADRMETRMEYYDFILCPYCGKKL